MLIAAVGLAAEALDAAELDNRTAPLVGLCARADARAASDDVVAIAAALALRSPESRVRALLALERESRCLAEAVRARLDAPCPVGEASELPVYALNDEADVLQLARHVSVDAARGARVRGETLAVRTLLPRDVAQRPEAAPGTCSLLDTARALPEDAAAPLEWTLAEDEEDVQLAPTMLDRLVEQASDPRPADATATMIVNRLLPTSHGDEAFLLEFVRAAPSADAFRLAMDSAAHGRFVVDVLLAIGPPPPFDLAVVARELHERGVENAVAFVHALEPLFGEQAIVARVLMPMLEAHASSSDWQLRFVLRMLGSGPPRPLSLALLVLLARVHAAGRPSLAPLLDNVLEHRTAAPERFPARQLADAAAHVGALGPVPAALARHLGIA